MCPHCAQLFESVTAFFVLYLVARGDVSPGAGLTSRPGEDSFRCVSQRLKEALLVGRRGPLRKFTRILIFLPSLPAGLADSLMHRIPGVSLIILKFLYYLQYGALNQELLGTLSRYWRQDQNRSGLSLRSWRFMTASESVLNTSA